MNLSSPPETKDVEVIIYTYADTRANAPAPFASQEFVVDRSRGDEVSRGEDGATRLYIADRAITVKPGWLWVEQFVRTVKVPPPATTKV